MQKDHQEMHEQHLTQDLFSKTLAVLEAILYVRVRVDARRNAYLGLTSLVPLWHCSDTPMAFRPT